MIGQDLKNAHSEAFSTFVCQWQIRYQLQPEQIEF